MRKVVYGFLLSIIIVCCTFCIFLFSSTQNMKADLDEVKKEIKAVKENISNADSNNKTLTQTYEELLVESSDKVYENQIWQETKEKLEQALSQ